MQILDQAKAVHEFKLIAGLSLEQKACAIPFLYYDLMSNIKAIAHPFVHGIQILRSIMRIIYGFGAVLGLVSIPQTKNLIPHIFLACCN